MLTQYSSNLTFNLLNLAIWFGICKGLSVVHSFFGRFVNDVSAFHISPALDLISTFNWFDLVNLKLQHGRFLFDNEMMTQIFMETRKHIRKRSSSETSGTGDFRRFELQNKQRPLSVHKLQWPPNPYLNVGSLVLIKRLFCFSRRIAGQVKSRYFKHCIYRVKAKSQAGNMSQLQDT